MKTNYYNPTTGDNGAILSVKVKNDPKGRKNIFHAQYVDNGKNYSQIFDTYADAHHSMCERGYEKTGIMDETGCRRYTMTLPELQNLYKKFENFVADCTQEEYNANKSSIIAVYTLLHKHINKEYLK